MTRDRAALVEHARDSIARGSKSFALASQIFDRPTRERAWLLYAWCRRCDDLADGQDHGGEMAPVADPLARLAAIRAMTDTALAGGATGDPAFDGFGLVAEECRIPHRFAHDLIEGFALDAADWRPESEDDLLRYCYHVAGAVGCMMAVVMGVDRGNEAALDRACDLGLAFQLSNIARDIAEDTQAGRCYLPAAWLREKHVTSAELLNPEHRPALGEFGQRLAGMAARYEESARHGSGHLSFRSAWAVLAAAGIYGDIARTVAMRGRNAWDERVVTSSRAKLGWVARALFQCIGRKMRWPVDDVRQALWVRPRAEPAVTHC